LAKEPETYVKDKKILIADDSAATRKVAELAFAASRYEVITAANGAAAMQSFVEDHPDAVIVAADLPGTSGYQISEMIKSDPATSLIPVFLTVGSFVPIDHEFATVAQANGIITKPFASVKDLVAKVDEYFQMPVDDVSLANTLENIDTKELDDETQTYFEPAVGTEIDDIGELYMSSLTGDAVPAERPSGGLTEMATTVEPPDGADVPRTLGRNAEPDDDLIETVHVDPPLDDDLIIEEKLNGLSAVEAPKDGGMRKFDWSPEAIVSEVFGEDEGNDFKTKFTFAADESLPLASAGSHTGSSEASGPDPALVEAIVNAVIERLSDKVVRDVAHEVVPRITERLIREALDDDKAL
jgi:CheY-like chemotaxis protein